MNFFTEITLDRIKIFEIFVLILISQNNFQLLLFNISLKIFEDNCYDSQIIAIIKFLFCLLYINLYIYKLN